MSLKELIAVKGWHGYNSWSEYQNIQIGPGWQTGDRIGCIEFAATGSMANVSAINFDFYKEDSGGGGTFYGYVTDRVDLYGNDFYPKQGVYYIGSGTFGAGQELKKITFNKPEVMNGGYNTTWYLFIQSTVTLTISATATDKKAKIGFTYDTYSKCGKPTNVKLSPLSVGPNGASILSWNAGTAGVNNAIYGYSINIYNYQTSKETKLCDVGKTILSKTVFAPTGNGEKYAYRVYTVATAGGYSSDWSDWSPDLVCNFSAPTVSGVTLGGKTTEQYRAAAGSIKLAWIATDGVNNNVTSYAVEYSDNGITWVLCDNTTAKYYDVAAPAAGSNRRFRVIAVAPHGNSGPVYSPYLYAYSAPSAPTTVSVLPTSAFPGDAISITWAGASEGVGVGIKGYNVYQDGIYLNYTTGKAFSINAPAAGTHKYKIITIGKVTNYNSGDSPEATLTVNNPKSTGTLNKATVPMDGASQIKITIAPAGDYTHKAVWYTPGGVEIVHDVSGTTDTLTMPKNWCEYFPNTMLATNLGKCRLETYSGGTKVGDIVYSFTLTVPADVVPTVSLDLIPIGVFGDYYLKGISKVTLDDNAAGVYGSTIIAHSLYGGGYSGDTDPFTTGVLTIVGETVLTVTVTDSRYQQATAQKTITVTNYNNPVISSVSAVRCDEDGTENFDGLYAKINALLTITDLTGNSIALSKVEYKKSGDAEWTLVSGALSSGVDKIIGGALAINTSYDIKITLKDTVGKETPGLYQAIIPPAVRAWDFRNDRAALGRIAGGAKTFLLPNDWETNINAEKIGGKYASDFAPSTIGTVADKTLMTGTDGIIVAKTMEEAIAIWKFTNPNLLHNWDFRNPVNQRGASGAILSGYFYDRWMIYAGITTIANGYLSLPNTAAIEQRIEGNDLAGKGVTVSVTIADVVYSNVGAFPTSAGNVSVTITGFGTVTLGYATGYMYVRYSANATRQVQTLKLELGTVSTLAYDAPMDYGTELLKCQRYFWKPRANYPVSGYSHSTEIRFYTQFPVTMRVSPTVTNCTFPELRGGGVANLSAATPSFAVFSGTSIRQTVPRGDIPTNYAVNGYMSASSEFSADL